MKYLALTLLVLVCLEIEPNWCVGEERAATAELPAALAAVGTGRAATLSRADAVRVRAEYFPTSGVRLVVQGGGVYNGSPTNYRFAAGGQKVTVAFTGSGLSFDTQGLAVIGTAPPVQGVMAASTNAFTGTVAFQGATSNIQVVALPNQFMIVVP